MNDWRNRLPGVPEHMASGWVSYTFSDDVLGGLVIGGGLRYVGQSYGDDANTIDIPDYTLFDASISYDLGRAFRSLEGASVRVSATNLTDRRHVVSSTAAGAAWYGSSRNVSLSLNYVW